MRGCMVSTGRLFGSVALRYRGPLCATGGSPMTGRGICRFLGLGEPSDELPRGDDGPATRSPRLSGLEAVLLLARQPQGSRRLAQLADLADGTEARTLVRALNQLYDAEGSAFRVEEVAGGFQLMSRRKFAPWLRRLHNTPVELRLSAPAIETLAVVAYRQPVLRVEVEAIRGVQCGEILRQLIERDLVRITGRSNELGRPLLYGTTKYFLQVFGLRHLDELPRAELLHEPNHSHEAEEETNVKTSTTPHTAAEPLTDFDANAEIAPEHGEEPDADLPFEDLDDEDLDDDEYDDEDEDTDIEDQPWEEVGEDEDEEEEDEEEEDEDDDWDDDDWDDEEDEEDEEDK